VRERSKTTNLKERDRHRHGRAARGDRGAR